jgi:hypothetical protein
MNVIKLKPEATTETVIPTSLHLSFAKYGSSY